MLINAADDADDQHHDKDSDENDDGDYFLIEGCEPVVKTMLVTK